MCSLAYSVKLIEEILETNQPEKSPTDVFIMYDIACSLHKYLQVGSPEIIFQCYSLMLYIIHFSVMGKRECWKRYTYPSLFFIPMGTRHHVRYYMLAQCPKSTHQTTDALDDVWSYEVQWYRP